MPNDNLLSITPIDGRYESQTKFLANYFSEFALIKTRVEPFGLQLLIGNQEDYLKNLDGELTLAYCAGPVAPCPCRV